MVIPEQFIGVDVGGTKVAIASLQGGRLSAPYSEATALSSAADLIEQLVRLIDEVRTAHARAVGVGVPSVVEFATGRIRNSVNIPLVDVPLRTLLAERVGLPVYVENDANCAALAEAQFTEDAPAQSLVMLTLGTGVGGGVVIEGRIFRGSSGLGAELGHVVVDAEGPECPGACPNRGCLEALCSGTALEREATAAAGGQRVKGREVVERARGGDGDAQALLDRLGRWLGIGISDLVNVFEPRPFVIGGGLSAAADLFLDAAEAEFRARALPALAAGVRISVAKAGNDAGVIGAGLLAAQELGLSGDTPGSPAREEVG